MGIPGFFKWIRNNYRQSVSNTLPNKVSSLALDLNGLIHTAAQQIYAYGAYEDNKERQVVIQKMTEEKLKFQLEEMVTNLIMNLLNKVNPQDCLIIAVDGLINCAKIQQQRIRRFRSAMSTKMPHLIRPDPNNPSVLKLIFDSNSITPGTELMFSLDLHITNWILSNRDKLPGLVIYGSHLSLGEGEQTIVDLYRQGKVPGNQAHVIYGLDADLILLSLTLKSLDIYLMRDISPSEFTKHNVLDVKSFKLALHQYLANDSRFINTDVINDFILMMTLIGNDFIPHQSSMKDPIAALDVLVNAYKQLPTRLTRNGKVDWNEFGKFLKDRIQPQEMKLYLDLVKNNISIPLKAAYKNGRLDMPGFRAMHYAEALGIVNEELMKKITGMEIVTVSEDSVVEMGISYMKGVEWSLLYTLSGKDAVSNSYFYKYRFAPLIVDLIGLISRSPIITGIDNLTNIQYYSFAQLLAVLPPQSYQLLPRELQHLMMFGSSIVDLYPISFNMFSDDKDEHHSKIPNISYADIERINSSVSTIFFDVKRYQPVALREFARTTTSSILPNISNIIAENKQRQEIISSRGRGGYSERSGSNPRGRGFERTRGRRGGRGGRGERGRGIQVVAGGYGNQYTQGFESKGGERSERGGRGRGYSERGGRGYSERSERGGRGYGGRGYIPTLSQVPPLDSKCGGTRSSGLAPIPTISYSGALSMFPSVQFSSTSTMSSTSTTSTTSTTSSIVPTSIPLPTQNADLINLDNKSNQG